MSYNKFTREIMCWSLNTYPFGCCSLPMQRDWKEYVSIKNDIKVVVIDKANTLACFSGAVLLCQPLLTLDNNECIDTREFCRYWFSRLSFVL